MSRLLGIKGPQDLEQIPEGKNFRPLVMDDACNLWFSSTESAQESNCLIIDNKDHNLKLGGLNAIPAYIDSNGRVRAAIGDEDLRPRFLVVGIPNKDQLKITKSGFVETTATHSLDIGVDYYADTGVSGGITKKKNDYPVLYVTSANSYLICLDR